jgi:hypothetical protein
MQSMRRFASRETSMRHADDRGRGDRWNSKSRRARLTDAVSDHVRAPVTADTVLAAGKPTARSSESPPSTAPTCWSSAFTDAA